MGLCYHWSQFDLTDPHGEKKSPWPTIVVVIVLLWIAYAALNGMGYIYEWANGRLGQPKPVPQERAKDAAGAATRAPEATK